MHKIVLLFLLFSAHSLFAQKKITWKTLRDVNFTDEYSEEVDAYFYYPHFGQSIKDLEGKELYLRGYMLPMDPENGVFILSQNPYASCFFCGSGGPESIVELNLKPNHPKFRMDQVVTIKGKLRLNRDDVYTCNYVFDDAEVFKE